MSRDRIRGFTLIELLIVMGIVMMLMGIAVLAFEKLEKVAGDQTTQTRLAACISILNEYKITMSSSGGALGNARAPPAPRETLAKVAAIVTAAERRQRPPSCSS